MAINAAKQFTITQRQKLDDLGLLNVSRPIKIIGESVSNTCDIGDCVIDYDDTTNSVNDDIADADTKIIHFQRHGQGYHNLICDMYREFSIPIDFDSPDPAKNPVVRPEVSVIVLHTSNIVLHTSNSCMILSSSILH